MACCKHCTGQRLLSHVFGSEGDAASTDGASSSGEFQFRAPYSTHTEAKTKHSAYAMNTQISVIPKNIQILLSGPWTRRTTWLKYNPYACLCAARFPGVKILSHLSAPGTPKRQALFSILTSHALILRNHLPLAPLKSCFQADKRGPGHNALWPTLISLFKIFPVGPTGNSGRICRRRG